MRLHPSEGRSDPEDVAAAGARTIDSMIRSYFNQQVFREAGAEEVLRGMCCAEEALKLLLDEDDVEDSEDEDDEDSEDEDDEDSEDEDDEA